MGDLNVDAKMEDNGVHNGKCKLIVQSIGFFVVLLV